MLLVKQETHLERAEEIIPLVKSKLNPSNALVNIANEYIGSQWALYNARQCTGGLNTHLGG